MDAVIRFCFLIDGEKIEDLNEYAKIYGQAKWMLDYTSIMETKKAVNSLL